MLEIKLIPESEFARIRQAEIDHTAKLALLGDMCRANTLATVKRAGSGHLGSSFSSLDIVTLLYFSEMNLTDVGIDHPDRDIYFSSKGHDVPGHYAVLYALGLIPKERFINLRRLGGTHGHPDLGVPAIEANSGSLGMGISKAKGMAWAKQYKGRGGRVFVMTGDGELQEGQIWESLQTTVQQKMNNINVIVDGNKIQSDKPLDEIVSLGDLERKFAAFGWYVERCDGHDFKALAGVFERFKSINDQPKVLIADTVKGKGVSFMEGPASLEAGQGLYQWHSGAPGDDDFSAGYDEIIEGLNRRLEALDQNPLQAEIIDQRERNRTRLKDTAEKVVTAYGEALVEIGKQRQDVIVMDADLSADCGLRPFEYAFPERFIESGIAEQDMVSTAGGLALQGLLPITNSFGVFLASRANEQIYNNASEKTKIIYVCHFAGLIPAGPGKSHQSLRDVSLFGALPDVTILEPCNAAETREALRWCVNEAEHSCMIRLVISPSPRTIALPEGYRFTPGQGAVLQDGRDAVLFAYGPVMLNEALAAAEIMKDKGHALKVVNLPWLNTLDQAWLKETIGECQHLFTLDNHATYGGVGDNVLNALMAAGALGGRHLEKFGIDTIPACGTPPEVLRYHQLDGESLAGRILAAIDRKGI
jgi:transketolase